MQDAGKVIIGILIFLGILSVPVWVTQAAGNADKVPNIVTPTQEEIDNFIANTQTDMTGYDADNPDCIEDTEYMRLNHMKIVMDWRKWSVREDTTGDPGDAFYTADDGQEWFMSLTDTCLGCHTDTTAFCDQCHNYTATQVGCWECHVKPGG